MSDRPGLFDGGATLMHERVRADLDALEVKALGQIRQGSTWLDMIHEERKRLAVMSQEELAVLPVNPADGIRFAVTAIKYTGFAEWWYDKHCTCKHSAHEI